MDTSIHEKRPSSEDQLRSLYFDFNNNRSGEEDGKLGDTILYTQTLMEVGATEITYHSVKQTVTKSKTIS